MHSEQGNVKIFAGKTGQSFAKKMCNYLGTELGNSEVIHFSDGNIFVRIKETVRNSDVYLVQPIGMDPNNELVEILFWIDAFKRASASSITVIVPYFGYAKGDKKDEPRVSIRARVCADCIEVVGADRFITMDLHAPQIQGFFRIPSDHLYSLPLLCESVKKYVDVKNLVVVSPDAGFAKTARKYADYLGTPVAIGDKTRVAHDEKAKILELIGDVTDKDCLIVDDFSISGGTLIDIAFSPAWGTTFCGNPASSASRKARSRWSSARTRWKTPIRRTAPRWSRYRLRRCLRRRFCASTTAFRSAPCLPKSRERFWKKAINKIHSDGKPAASR